MIISPSRNFVFVHLEKCGGTSVESALEPYLHWSDMILGSTDFGEGYQQLLHNRFGVNKVRSEMLWKHSSAKDIYQFVTPDEWSNFNKISIVRNPVEVMRSLYNFSKTTLYYHVGRINRSKWKQLIATQDFPDSWPYTEPWFHSFAKSEIDGSGADGFVKEILSLDNHIVSPQVERIKAFEKDGLGYVFDLSQINERWGEILEIIGIEDYVGLDILNSSRDYETEFSPRSIKLIKKQFALDYDVLPEYTGTTW